VFSTTYVEAFSGACGALNQINCGTITTTKAFTGLVPSSTIYFRLYDWGNNNLGNITLGAFDPAASCPAPGNDDCGGAYALTITGQGALNCGPSVAGTNAGATASADASPTTATPCFYSGGDIWFSAVVPSTGGVGIDIGNTSPWGTVVVNAYIGNCGTLTQVGNNCQSSEFTNYEVSGLTPGDVVYFRLWEGGNNAVGLVEVCAYELPQAPDNDDCDDAEEIEDIAGSEAQCGNAIVNVSTLGGTASTVGGSCNTTSQNDEVWYFFEAPGSSVQLQFSNIQGILNSFYIGSAIYSGSCNSLVSAGCDFFSDGNNIIEYSINYGGLTPGDEYYIRLWFPTIGNSGTFDLCVFETTPPSNDACADAEEVEHVAIADCSYQNFRSTYATNNGGPTGCTTTAQNDDVWFVFEAEATSMFVQVANMVGTPFVVSAVGVALYTDDCTSGTNIGCDFSTLNGAGGTDISDMFTGLTIGDEYYIRIWSTSSSTSMSSFDLCVLYPPPPPPNNDCLNALAISCGDVISGSTTWATQSVTPFCGTSNTTSGIWYTLTGTGGEATITTCSPNTNYDTKLSVYTGSCGSFICVAGNDDATCVNSFLQSTVRFCSEVGTDYYILVHGFSSQKGDFDLSVTCTPPPDHDNPCMAIDIPVDGGPIATNNKCATGQSGEPTPGAGTSGNTCQSQDGWCAADVNIQNSVWYTFTAPPAGGVSIAACTIDLQMALYEVGNCNDFSTYTLLAANDDGGDCGTLSARIREYECLTPGNTYYVQVDGYNGVNGTFTMEVTSNKLPTALMDCCQDVGIECGGTACLTTEVTGIANGTVTVTLSDGSTGTSQLDANGLGTVDVCVSPTSTTSLSIVSVQNGCGAQGTICSGQATVAVSGPALAKKSCEKPSFSASPTGTHSNTASKTGTNSSTTSSVNDPCNNKCTGYDACLTTRVVDIQETSKPVGAAYVISGTFGEPWGSTSNQASMNAVYGAGNWAQLNYETTDPNVLFSNAYNVVYLDGGANNAQVMESFVNSNVALMEAWVNSGGALLVNAGPWTGYPVNMNYPFGINFQWIGGGPYIATGTAVNATHPIFVGPNPTATTISGNFFTHGLFAAQTASPIIVNNLNPSEVALMEVHSGAGVVLYGSMTASSFHSPQPQANNLRSNILEYLNSESTISLGAGCDGRIITLEVSVDTACACAKSGSLSEDEGTASQDAIYKLKRAMDVSVPCGTIDSIWTDNPCLSTFIINDNCITGMTGFRVELPKFQKVKCSGSHSSDAGSKTCTGSPSDDDNKFRISYQICDDGAACKANFCLPLVAYISKDKKCVQYESAEAPPCLPQSIDNFDNGIAVNFQVQGGAVNTDCGTFAGAGALHFDASGTRTATLTGLSLGDGAAISFGLVFGSGTFASGCENADAGEDVVLEYSIDGGLTWVNMRTFDTEDYTSWTLITRRIPAAAQTANTSLRFRQVSHSGANNDNWSIDDVSLACLPPPPPPPACVAFYIDSFDAVLSPLWDNISNGSQSTSCGSQGGNALYFTSGTGLERSATTVPLQIGDGASVSFGIVFGTGSSPCENADANEDVVLEASLDNGVSWEVVNTYDTEAFLTFTTVTEAIPYDFQSTNTMLRWRQLSHSGTNFDNWALDNIFVTCPQVTPKMNALNPKLDNFTGISSVSAYPNPTSSSTTINFTISSDENVKLEVYNSSGALVSILFDGKVEGGSSNAVEFDANSLPGGVYIYKLHAGSEMFIDKISVIK
jgi:hypothetical protein